MTASPDYAWLWIMFKFTDGWYMIQYDLAPLRRNDKEDHNQRHYFWRIYAVSPCFTFKGPFLIRKPRQLSQLECKGLVHRDTNNPGTWLDLRDPRLYSSFELLRCMWRWAVWKRSSVAVLVGGLFFEKWTLRFRMTCLFWAENLRKEMLPRWPVVWEQARYSIVVFVGVQPVLHIAGSS